MPKGSGHECSSGAEYIFIRFRPPARRRRRSIGGASASRTQFVGARDPSAPRAPLYFLFASSRAAAPDVDRDSLGLAHAKQWSTRSFGAPGPPFDSGGLSRHREEGPQLAAAARMPQL